MVKKTKKEEIYKIAAKIFGEKGYDGTSLDEIALKAKVAKGTIFYYFSNKEELFLSLIDRGMDVLTDKITKIDKQKISSGEKLRLVIECHFMFFKKYRSVGMMILNQLGYLQKRWNKRLDEAKRKYISVMQKIIIEGKEDGSIANDLKTDGIIISLFSLLAAVGLDWSIFAVEIAQNTMTETVKNIVFRGIKSSVK